jgi:hypothetical protein
MLTRIEMAESRLRDLPDDFRKENSFECCVPETGPVVLTEVEWDSIPHKAFPDVSTPMSELPLMYEPYSTKPIKLWLFIFHARGGKTYLVNTEEYNYCRYTIECVKEYIPRVGHSILPYTGEE